MYFPYLSKRLPSNRDCRVASIESLVGFITFASLLLGSPKNPGLFVFLLWVGVTVALFYVGLGTLLRDRPNQALIWPQLRSWTKLSRRDQPLDERDAYIRHRVFVVSYQILVAIALAGAIAGAMAGQLPQVLTSQDGVVLLVWLILLLPHWVLPWLESEFCVSGASESEPEAAPSSISPNNEGRSLRRIIFSWWFVWGVVASIGLLRWYFRTR